MKEFNIYAFSPDGVGFIKRHPEMFLQSAGASAEILGLELATKIVGGALTLTDQPVTALKRSDWWIIYSDADWLTAHPEFTAEEAFLRIIPLPEMGEKAIRAELMLVAFASLVVTMREGEITVIKGDLTARDNTILEAETLNRGRLIAFRL